MKLTKRISTTIATGLFVIVIVLFGLNSFVRVSDSENGHGIVEDWLFGRSLTSKVSQPLKSENLTCWEDSSDLSKQVASALTSRGPNLLDDPSRESERIRTANMARTAHELASSIPLDYLRASNSELPKMYTRHFVAANKLWADGLTQRRQDLVVEGIDHYNTFILWMQSKEGSDFSSMK